VVWIAEDKLHSYPNFSPIIRFVTRDKVRYAVVKV
jgi:hypothetical protein